MQAVTEPVHELFNGVSKKKAKLIVIKAMKILKNHPLTVASTIFTIKPALTKVNASRNWALKEAEKQVKSLEIIQESPVPIDWSNRCVNIGNDIVFSQTREDLKGTFWGIASHLKLP